MSHLSHYVWNSTVYCSNTHEFPKFVSQFSDFRGGFLQFLKKLPQIKLILRNWEILVQIEKIICLNCKDGGEGSTRTKIVSIKIVSIGLKGGRVKSIETLSQNMQFFFFGGFPNGLFQHKMPWYNLTIFVCFED